MTTLKSKVVALGLAGALALVPVYEGLSLRAYRDPLGILTDCYGHTGAGVQSLNTLAQCEEKLSGDLLEAHRTVQRCTKVPLNPNQRSAFTSFAYNVGPGGRGVKDGFCSLKSGAPPTLLRKLNAGDYTGACQALMQWTMPGTSVHNGLVRRRTAEMELCLRE